MMKVYNAKNIRNAFFKLCDVLAECGSFFRKPERFQAAVGNFLMKFPQVYFRNNASYVMKINIDL